jgi:hypothetical protein
MNQKNERTKRYSANLRLPSEKRGFQDLVVVCQGSGSKSAATKTIFKPGTTSKLKKGET